MTSALGLADRTVRLVPYDPAWPTLFEAETARLQSVFAQRDLIVQCEHMGSTAVPGLAAKPVLDMLCGHAQTVSRVQTIAALVEAGYTHRGEQGIAGRDFFRRGVPRQYHLHLTTIDSAFWRDHLAFRDHLRTHPHAAAAYAALKHRLAAQFPHDRPAYITGKTDFVRRMLAMAARASLHTSASPSTA